MIITPIHVYIRLDVDTHVEVLSKSSHILREFSGWGIHQSLMITRVDPLIQLTGTLNSFGDVVAIICRRHRVYAIATTFHLGQA